MDDETARTAVANSLTELNLGEAKGKGAAIERIRDVFLAFPSLAEEFAAQLEETTKRSSPDIAGKLCEAFAFVAKQGPSAAIMALSFRIAKQLLVQHSGVNAALQLTSTALAAAHEESKLKYSEEKIWQEYHGAAEVAVRFVDAGPMQARVRAVKLLQAFLLLLTAPFAGRLARNPSQVAQQVQQYLKQLVGILRQAATGAQNSVLTLTALHVAQQIIISRPGQAGRLLPGMLALATADHPEACRASIQKLLKASLLAILACEANPLRAWKSKIEDALRSLGVRIKESPPPGNGQQHAATAKSQEPAPAPVSNAESTFGQQQHEPQLLQQISYQTQGHTPAHALEVMQTHTTISESSQAPAVRADGDETSQADIQQVLAIVAALLAENDQATCLAFVTGLPPAVLADVVLVGMANLPRKEDILGQEPQGRDQQNGNVLLAGFMQATASPEEGPPPSSSAGAVLPNFPHTSSQPMQPTLSTEQLPAGFQATKQHGSQIASQVQPVTMSSPGRPPPAPAGGTPPHSASLASSEPTQAGLPSAKAAGKTPTTTAIRLQPLRLSDSQMALDAQEALKRVLKSSLTSCMPLRSSILAHASPRLQSDEWANTMAEELVLRKERGGYELALQWLFAIFASTLPPPQPSSQDIRAESGKDASSSGQEEVQASPAYARCLQTLLEACSEKLGAKDRTAAQLLVEAPALPDALLKHLLQKLLHRGGDFATLALITARDVILLRPRNRAQALQCMLEMAIAADSEIRAKAVRLVANKLFPNLILTEDIQRFATEQLQGLCQAAPGRKRPREPAEADDVDAKKARKDTAGSSAVSSNNASSEPTENGKAEGISNDASRSPLPEAEGQCTESAAARSKQGGGRHDRKGAAVLPEGTPSEPVNGTAEFGSDGRLEAHSEESPEEASRYCELYCALCTKRHALLRELFAVFGNARPPARVAILRNADGLARVLGASAPALLTLIDDLPGGAESLLLKMLYFLTESQPPPQVLVDACRKYYERTQDPSILPPALAGLPKEEIVELLPRLLEPVSLFGIALARILVPGASGEAAMTPTEVLLALHSMDPAKTGVRLKQIIGALDYCLTQRETFGKSVLASALQQLHQRSTLPPLYMRFLMQSQAAVPDLKRFMIEQLAALVSRQIWTNKTLFTGWNLAVRQNAPESFPAFLQLPMRVLTETLQASPEEFQLKLKEYATSPACPANQQKPILRLFETLGK